MSKVFFSWAAAPQVACALSVLLGIAALTGCMASTSSYADQAATDRLNAYFKMHSQMTPQQKEAYVQQKIREGKVTMPTHLRRMSSGEVVRVTSVATESPTKKDALVGPVAAQRLEQRSVVAVDNPIASYRLKPVAQMSEQEKAELIHIFATMSKEDFARIERPKRLEMLRAQRAIAIERMEKFLELRGRIVNNMRNDIDLGSTSTKRQRAADHIVVAGEQLALTNPSGPELVKNKCVNNILHSKVFDSNDAIAQLAAISHCDQYTKAVEGINALKYAIANAEAAIKASE